ncbi:MAG: SUMF1/EgtB/PvdO family nonheme iron enzyme [Candidatus Aegiribacteria sp.]|nr:SUMF1/EgtB/PvdO family nonheme iron enzyme [Candidatus Aegiribacteria sp.]
MKLLLISSAVFITCSVMASGTDPASDGPLDGMHFVSIPSGEFLIGSDISGGDYFDEIPQMIVQINSFEIMSTEVTQGMWEELMDCDSSSIPFLWTDLCGKGSNYPVYAVSWFDCREFINELNTIDSSYIYRLPGEAEWEYACRAGNDADFFWGDSDQASRYCHYRVNKLDQTNASSHIYGTREAASLEANSTGLFDMAGNVSEWCQDRYSPDYDYLPPDGTPFLYPCDDQWPYQMNTRRVHRGGSWLTILNECRSGNRNSQPPELWATCIGFRLVRVPRNNKNYALILFQEGVDSIDANSNRDGIELFTRALELDPTMIDALIYRGFFRQGLGETEQALSDFDIALQLDPENAASYQMMGVVLSDAEYYLQALKVFNRVVELDPDYPSIYYHRGFAQLFLWNFDDAISDFSLAIEYNPSSPSPYYARGTAYYLNEQNDRALWDLSATIERNPNDGEAYMLRSEIHRHMGNLEQAESDRTSAAALGTDK